MNDEHATRATHNARQILIDAGGVLSAVAGMLLATRGQARERLRQRLDVLIERLPLASRDECAALRAALQRARQEQDALTQRVTACEAALAAAASPVKEELNSARSRGKQRAASAKARRPSR